MEKMILFNPFDSNSGIEKRPFNGISSQLIDWFLYDDEIGVLWLWFEIKTWKSNDREKKRMRRKKIKKYFTFQSNTVRALIISLDINMRCFQ